MPGPLKNPRRERFAQALADGETADRAYKIAGYGANRGNATRMKAKPDVAARVAEILGGAAERVEISQAAVLAELGKIGFSDIRKLFTDGGKLRRIEDLDDDAAACLSSVEVVTRRVAGSDRDDPEYEKVSKIRLWDKRAALVDIGKHLGMFTERVEHTGKDGGPIEIDDKEMARRIAFALTRAARA